MPQSDYVPCLLSLFRQHGYDGATLAKISAATGLGKASLYHHFPGGKDEMVTAVLDFLEQWLVKNILQPLRQEGDALTRLRQMGDRLNDLYEGGEQPCLFAILLLGSARDVFQAKVRALLQAWIDEIALVLIQAGMVESEARLRGEDGAIAVQGSLIISQGLGTPTPFQRVIRQLPEVLCRGLPNLG
jgi:TetR/AcrR family transcriptional regulator, lmrAB and yxaGH operons repressor